MSQGSLDPKIRFLGQKVCSIARMQTHRQTDTLTDRHADRQTHRQANTQTDRHTDRQTVRVTTEGTLSGYQDFFLQPII